MWWQSGNSKHTHCPHIPPGSEPSTAPGSASSTHSSSRESPEQLNSPHAPVPPLGGLKCSEPPAEPRGAAGCVCTQCELLPSSSPCLPWGLRKTRGIQSKWSSAEGEKEPWCSQGWRDPRDAGSDTCPLLLSASPAPGNVTIPQRCCSSHVRAGHKGHLQLSGKTWPTKPP